MFVIVTVYLHDFYSIVTSLDVFIHFIKFIMLSLADEMKVLIIISITMFV